MRALFLAAWCLVGIGCASVQKPTASVVGMQIGDVRGKSFVMNFEVNVSNPNKVELPVGAAEYRLALSGVEIASGKANPQGTAPAGAGVLVTVPVAVTYESLLNVEESIVRHGGEVPYALDGSVLVDAGGLTLTRVPIQFSGVVKLQEVLKNPHVLMHSLAAQQLAKQVFGGLYKR